MLETSAPCQWEQAPVPAPCGADRNRQEDRKKKIMSIHSVSCAVGANPITIETGKIARLADGAVTVRCGDTVVLVTVVSATKIKDGQTFFPLL